ncbi:MAG: VOC family protein [Acidimicrobiia bacterium]|nr:VOC family protein [Acidimicrobiia bacterium]
MTDHRRPGFGTVTPYLIVEGAKELIEFIVEVFDAVELSRSLDEGTITNSAIRVGDSMIEVSEARGGWGPFQGSLHLYVEDTDAVYAKALKAGATSLHEPLDQPYGERSAAFRDPSGTMWFPATYTG